MNTSDRYRKWLNWLRQLSINRLVFGASERRWAVDEGRSVTLQIRHKVETTEVGPPAWRPDKTPCPERMTLPERTQLLRDSIAEDPGSPTSRHFAVRRSDSGLEFFAAEFLLPSEALREDAHSLDSYAEPERFEHLLGRYGVGAMTAAYHLWNRGFFSSYQVRDDLIDQFSSIQHFE